MSERKGRIQIILVAGFLIASFVLAMGVSNYNTKELQRVDVVENEVFVNYEQLEKKDYRVEIESTGVVNYRNYVEVVSQVEGRVKMVNENFYQGGWFNEGEKLFEIYDGDFVNKRAVAYSGFIDGQRKYEFELAKTQAAILEWQRFNPDQKPNDLVTNRKNLQAAKAAMDAAKAQLNQADLDLSRTKFRYDFAGRVIDSEIEVGQFVDRGKAYGKVYDVNSMQINSNVTFGQLQDLGDWQKILVKINGVINGRIERIGAVLNDRTRFVDLFINSKNYQFLPGGIVDVTLLGKKFENVWVVSRDYLDKDGNIWLIGAENRAKKVKVTPIFTNKKIVIMDPVEGLGKIITSNIVNLTDEVKIKTAI